MTQDIRNLACLQGSSWRRLPPHPAGRQLARHKLPEGEPGGEGVPGGGSHCPHAPGSPSSGTGPGFTLLPRPQKEAAGLEIRSARPGLVSLCSS